MTDVNVAKKRPMRRALILGGILIVGTFLTYTLLMPVVASKLFVVAVSGTSMQPTLDPQHTYLLIKTDKPSHGDIVVGDPPKEWVETFKTNMTTDEAVVKRVVGLPGDKLELREENLYVNGKKGPHVGVNGVCTPIDSSLTVPDGKIFAVGDNRATSFDSMAAWCTGSDVPFYLDQKEVLTTGYLPAGAQMFGEMIK